MRYKINKPHLYVSALCLSTCRRQHTFWVKSTKRCLSPFLPGCVFLCFADPCCPAFTGSAVLTFNARLFDVICRASARLCFFSKLSPAFLRLRWTNTLKEPLLPGLVVWLLGVPFSLYVFSLNI